MRVSASGAKPLDMQQQRIDDGRKQNPSGLNVVGKNERYNVTLLEQSRGWKARPYKKWGFT